MLTRDVLEDGCGDCAGEADLEVEDGVVDGDLEVVGSGQALDHRHVHLRERRRGSYDRFIARSNLTVMVK